MNESCAEQQGFSYTGPTISPYSRLEDKAKWEAKLALAKDIKKNYMGADYRVVTGTKNSWLSQGHKGIYGNEVFNKIYNLLAYSYTSDFANRHKLVETYRQRAKEDFEKRMAELDNMENEILADEKYLKDMHKGN